MEYNVKGGFPRLKVLINKIEEKHVQGFANHNLYSIKNIIGKKNLNPLKTRVLYGGKNNKVVPLLNEQVKKINGIPIEMFAK